MEELILTPMCVSHELTDLSNKPHRDIPETDLAIVARYEDGIINEVKSGGQKLSDEEILAIVDEHRPEYVLVTMDEALGNSPEAEKLKDEDVPTLYVLGTDGLDYGASALGYPEELEKAYAILGEGFVILPSSVHELILMPDSKRAALYPEDLQLMVEEINKAAVPSWEVLSNSVYHFDGEELTILAAPKNEDDEVAAGDKADKVSVAEETGSKDE